MREESDLVSRRRKLLLETAATIVVALAVLGLLAYGLVAVMTPRHVQVFSNISSDLGR
jgi:hypothetical protein